MKTAIPCLYAEYGRYTDELRMIPLHRDCLKPVERRIMYVLHQVARGKFVKCARVVGDTIGKYHPHGDASTYDSLVSLAHRGYAIKQGNFGSKSLSDMRYAAYRYTEIKAEPFVDSFAFELIDFVKWGDPENLSEEQPMYLSTPVPLGLIGEGIISGISFNTTKIPRFTLPDLLNRLTYLFKKEFNPNEPIVTIVPNIPDFHIYENEPGDFENILTIGKGGIKLVPHSSADAYGVHVFGKPPGGISKWKRGDLDGHFKLIDLSSKGKFEALFQTPTGHAPDQQFINNILEYITSKVHFLCNTVLDDGTVELKPIDDLLLGSYEHWSKLLETRYQNEKLNLIEKIFQLEVIGVVRTIVTTHNVNISKVDNVVTIYNQQYSHLHPNILEEHIRQVCSKHTIRTLIEHSLDTQSVQLKINAIDHTLSDIVNVAYNKAMGYVQTGD